MGDFNRIAAAYVEDLFKVAYTYVQDVQLAEDIVQDVFLKAYERQTQFRGEANYKTYLIRMTINRSHDMLRSWAYRNMVMTNTFTKLFRGGQSAEEVVFAQKHQSQLGQLILNLKPKYREVIFLYYYQDYSVKEIAELLGSSENTVKTRLSRARQRLKDKLDQKEAILDGSQKSER